MQGSRNGLHSSKLAFFSVSEIKHSPVTETNSLRGCGLADDFANLIRQIKDANDIVDVLGGYLPLKQTGKTFKALCPFHDDNRPSLDIDPQRQRYRCWACGKYGDVIAFIQEHDRVSFREALEVLARRAGISLEKFRNSQPDSGRAIMLESIRWAQQQYHNYLLGSPQSEEARRYIYQRKLTEETVSKYGLGFAPADGGWLVQQARAAKLDFEVLEQVGLIARRQEGKGYYDRFRDRVMFPIRDPRGQPVGFGGRILPSSPFLQKSPKYYNSAETQLFKKSELLYGLDMARHAAMDVGYLAIVEGYTDVLMAHQSGILPVVATMGTALNARHVQQLVRVVPQVILVFDADAGGTTGVDRALEIFVSHNVQLKVATLPQGLDPYDVILQEGADSFQSVLTNAKDVLEFKLTQVLSNENFASLEGRRRAIDVVLAIIARGPKLTDQAGQVKRELMVTHIAQRFGVREETIWARLKELRDDQREKKPNNSNEQPAVRKAPAAPHEKELLQILLADPELVAEANTRISVNQIEHPGLRKLLDGLYRLLAEGSEPTLDELRSGIDNVALISTALGFQEIGLANKDRRTWLEAIFDCFEEKQDLQRKHELQTKLVSAGDHESAVELLRQLQDLEE